MTEILSSAQMRAIEMAEIDSGAVTGLQLMERAGRGAVDVLFAKFPELSGTSRSAMILCGPGNNGGDGFVIARLLHGKGWRVNVFLYGDAARFRDLANAQKALQQHPDPHAPSTAIP